MTHQHITITIHRHIHTFLLYDTTFVVTVHLRPTMSVFLDRLLFVAQEEGSCHSSAKDIPNSSIVAVETPAALFGNKRRVWRCPAIIVKKRECAMNVCFQNPPTTKTTLEDYTTSLQQLGIDQTMTRRGSKTTGTWMPTKSQRIAAQCDIESLFL